MIKGSIFLFFYPENPIPTHLERPGFLERLALEEEAVSCQRVKVGGGEDRSEVNHLSHPLHRLLHLREGGREGGGGGHTSTRVEPVGRDGGWERGEKMEEERW